MKNQFSALSLRSPMTALGVTALLALGACTTYTPSFPPSAARNPIQISESIERLELYARQDGLSLSARDRDAVVGFLQGYRQSGDGPLYINSPQNGSSHAGIAQTQNLIRQDLAGLGISQTAVQTGQYQSAPGAPAPVVVSFRRLKAMPQDCRNMQSLSLTSNNQPSDSFGCAQSSNLAAMVNDPRQFLEPYATTEPNSARRMTVYDKYIQGENPASEQPARQQISSEE